MNLRNIILPMIAGLILFTGCGQKKPDGVPTLYPAKITLTNGGSPIADANVFLVFQGGTSGSWAVNGKTNAGGIAEVNTSLGDWKSKGAPEGEYKVYFTKIPVIEEVPLPPELQNDSDAIEKHASEQLKRLRDAPQVIPESLNNPAKTPLVLSVKKEGTAELAVDVSEHK